jgi:hypothetical protein
MASISRASWGLFFSYFFLSFFNAGTAEAMGRISDVQASSMGKFCGIRYVKYTGILEGKTGASADSAYRVPFVIRTPAKNDDGNGITLYEFPHFANRDFSRFNLGTDFLFCRGFSQASVGFSNVPEDGNNILDPSVPGTVVQGGVGRDALIMAEFARALGKKQEGGRLIGNNSRQRYLMGFSNASNPIVDLLDSGQAEGIFQLAMPCTTDGFNTEFTRSIKDVLVDGKFTGRVVVLNSEADEIFTEGGLHDDIPEIRDQYRYYFVPGTAHISETIACSSDGNGVEADGKTPASYHPELRARFLQGHRWVKASKHAPYPSTQPADPPIDEKGNALIVDIEGNPQPRLPMVELGEATYLPFNEVLPFPFNIFIGSVMDVESVSELGFSRFLKYALAFAKAGRDYTRAGGMLLEDELFLLVRALSIPGHTLTENYFSDYERAYVEPDRPNCADLP